ncbi:MAG: methyltransferase domain-containing protein [Myxococcales bacterium]
MSATVVLTTRDSRGTLAESVRQLRGQPGVEQILIADAGSRDGTDREAERLTRQGLCELLRLPRTGRGTAVRAALPRVRGETVVLLEPRRSCEPSDVPALIEPIRQGRADLVLGSRFVGAQRAVSGFWDALSSRTLAAVAGAAVDLALSDLGAGAQALPTAAARALDLRSEGAGVDAEIVAKVARMRYRILEVPVRLERGTPLREKGALLLSAFRYAAIDDAENEHGGYRTLQVMDQAPRYAEWLVSLMRPHLGRRVLEIGAGIGTITRQLLDRELVVPLDVEPRYVRQLENAFRGVPHVRPLCADASALDLEALRAERFDTVILSNVLEHLPDDRGALRTFRRLLGPGGRVLLVVPAHQGIYGSLDRAVGHHRRYGRRDLARLVAEAGFEVAALRAVNLPGIAGWVVNGRLLGRRRVPPLQLRLYDRLAPLVAAVERRLEPPVGLSLFCVAAVPELKAGAPTLEG